VVPIIQQGGWALGQVFTCVEKRKFLAFIGVQIPNHPSCCESLYQLRYPSHTVSVDLLNFPLFYKDLFFLLLSFYLFFTLVGKEFVRLIRQKFTLQTFLVLNRKCDIFNKWMRKNIPQIRFSYMFQTTLSVFSYVICLYIISLQIFCCYRY